MKQHFILNWANLWYKVIHVISRGISLWSNLQIFDLKLKPEGDRSKFNPILGGVFCLLVCNAASGWAQDTSSFITTWEVTADDLSLYIPTNSYAYDFTIDWGDGTTQTITGTDPTPAHTYTAGGTYTVSISGTFPSMYMANADATNALKLKTVEQWGAIEWQDMQYMFNRASNMTYNATDVPNLSQVTNASFMFSGAAKFNGDIGNWDVSTVTNMRNMFMDTSSFNQDLNTWDVSNVTNMYGMFTRATGFNGDISNWNVANVEGMGAMFYNAKAFNQDLGNWNMSKVIDLSAFLYNASAFSQDNYDALLVGWSQLSTLKTNITFSVSSSYSCAGALARQALIANFGWTIYDGGFNFPLPSLVLDENNQASITEAMLTANCGDYTVSASPNTFNCSNVGSNPITIDISDNLGNTTVETFILGISDATAPVVQTQDVTVTLDENEEATVTVDDVIASITDNCSTSFSSFFKTDSGIVSDLSQVYAFGYEDWYNDGGVIDYTSLHSYSFDQTTNTIANPSLVFNINAFDDQLDDTYWPIAFDQDPTTGTGYFIVGDGPRSLLTYNFSTQEVTDTGVNIDGNSADMTFDQFGVAYVWIGNNIKFLDLTTGVTSTLVGVTQGGGGKGLTYDYDNHRLLLVSGGNYSSAQISIGAVDLTTNTYAELTQVDAPVSNTVAPDYATFQGIEYIGNNYYLVSGGWWSYMFGLLNLETLEDGSAQPSFNVTVPNTYEMNPNQPGFKDLFVPYVTGSKSLTFEGCEAVGEYTYPLETKDASGNATVSNVTITVVEETAPTVLTKDITVQLDENGEASITAAQIDNGSTDNCAIESLALDKESFDCSNLGENTITLTVTDTSGNEATGTATVTVEDKLAPTALTQDLTVQLDENGLASITPEQLDNGSSDNCGIESLTLDRSDFDCSHVGENTVTLSVADASGNTATATAVVYVQPVVQVQDIVVALDENGSASVTADEFIANNVADCGVASVTADRTDFDCEDLGDYTVTLSVTDLQGNTFTEIALLTLTGDDYDGDLIADPCDPDDDNDGTPDTEDVFPFDENEDTDSDGDGIGDNADTVDDNADTGGADEVAQETDIVPAEAFTPNGDGNNDTWMVPGIENYPNSVVRVFNRWGHEVYAEQAYNNDWEGFYKQKREKLPRGSYLYTIDLGNGTPPLQGWIFINY